MVRGILFFLVVWAAVTVTIAVFRAMSGAEKWSAVKTLAYGGLTSAVASLLVGLMVVVF
ncbi:MAG TPA: hypothetical protein VK149_12190 [Sideroxyarcus sp.]|nr:hypothetical protein [Sideroxyarcus sp.]